MSELANEIIKRLAQFSTPEKQQMLPRFFKTGKGEYGEGDQFLGVVVPYTRQVAKEYKHIPFQAMTELLQSPWHECRLCALLMLVERFKKSDETDRKHIFDFYLTQTAHINNWDLVDRTCHKILGKYLYNLFISSKRTTPRKEITMKEEINVPALEIQELQMPQGMTPVSTLDNIQSVSNIQIPQVPQDIDPMQVQSVSQVDELTQQNLALQQTLQNYQTQQAI